MPAYKTHTLKLAYELFKGIDHGDVQYIYRGQFTPEINHQILLLSEMNLSSTIDKSSLRKKILFIMIEGLQNITRHQSNSLNNKPEGSSLFIAQQKDEHFYITTGNIIEQRIVPLLKQRIDTINTMDKESLRQYSTKTLAKGELSKKGGAGLGLIEIARKSGNKLNYAFKSIDNDLSYYYFNTMITTYENQKHDAFPDNRYSLENIKNLHDVLNKENILLNFKGFFTQDHLLNLLTIIEEKMHLSTSSLKIIKVLTELFQNIVQHGEALEKDQNGKPGIIMLNEYKGQYFLTAGNFIKNNTVPSIRKKIEHLNQMDIEQLNQYYKETMRQPGSTESAGLGFIDIRLKTKKPLNYNFYTIDALYSFYTIQATIN